MPQYELMYLLGSQVADNEVPAVSAQILKFIEDSGGSDIRETNLGKKKLAYPIKKTRNGYYVVVNFEIGSQKVAELDAKIRTQDSTIIRYMLVNLEEYLLRDKKDKIAQAKIIRRPVEVPSPEAPAKTASAPKATPVLEEIDEKALDEKIEAALSEDITK
jgi:small subunit ribosomal protein S6